MNFTLIFEYELPGKDFASLARWAKDWHKLEVQNLGTGGSFVPTSEYLNTLNELTYRFSNRGAIEISQMEIRLTRCEPMNF